MSTSEMSRVSIPAAAMRSSMARSSREPGATPTLNSTCPLPPASRRYLRRREEGRPQVGVEEGSHQGYTDSGRSRADRQALVRLPMHAHERKGGRACILYLGSAHLYLHSVMSMPRPTVAALSSFSSRPGSCICRGAGTCSRVNWHTCRRLALDVCYLGALVLTMPPHKMLGPCF